MEYSVSIQRSADEVFNLIGNPNDDAKWGSLIIESKQISPEPIGVGSQFEQIAVLLGARITLRIEVTDYQPGYLLRYQASEPFPIQHCRSVEETPTGSRLTFSAQIDARGKFHFAAPFLGQAIRRQMEADLDAIRAIVEGPSPKSSGVI